MDKEIEKYAKHFNVDLDEIKTPTIDIADGKYQITNPGSKQPESIERKAQSKSVSDVTRCTVSLDSYREIPDLVRFLREFIPDLKIEVTENGATGFRAVDLVFHTEGVPSCVGVASKKVQSVFPITIARRDKLRGMSIDVQSPEFLKDLQMINEFHSLIHDDGDFDSVKGELHKIGADLREQSNHRPADDAFENPQQHSIEVAQEKLIQNLTELLGLYELHLQEKSSRTQKIGESLGTDNL